MADFPGPIENRPALPRVDYRIGTYSSLRRHMLDVLNRSARLSDWSHRGADDPGIAVLEGAAIVGDILTYYQELYANESFLRTATWRESLVDLVVVLGYRPAPGLGGETTFALKVKGDGAVTVPKGFGIKVQLKDSTEPAEFETVASLTAYPHLSQFSLYCPPGPRASITAGADRNTLELASVGGKRDSASLESHSIKKGDRIMLVPDGSMFSGGAYTPQAPAEILTVADVKTEVDRVVLSFERPVAVDRGTEVKAYVVDRTFHHFGYNAAAKLTRYDGVNVTQEDTNFYRRPGEDTAGDDYHSAMRSLEIPLDRQVNDLPAGAAVIVQGLAYLYLPYGGKRGDGHWETAPFTITKRIAGVRADTLKWSTVEGPSTAVALASGLFASPLFVQRVLDIRTVAVHETKGPELVLAAPTTWPNGPFAEGVLQFFGTYDEVAALAERTVLLSETVSASPQVVRVASQKSDFDGQIAGRDRTGRWMWDITLEEKPSLSREHSHPPAPAVTMFGNVVFATQGKTEKETVLGSGDNQRAFQTFALPKKPLTYLLHEGQTPAQVPELEVRVQGIRWQPVDTFYNSAPDAQVYVVREDRDGKSYVQFGDGKKGARLPSGLNNVTAVYRTGIGATGLAKPDAAPQATGKLKEVDKVFMPGPAVGGAQPDGDDVRTAAPGRLQSLGRLVSLADYEAETLAVPGVTKASATWAAPRGVPLMRLVVLTRDGQRATLEKVRDAIMTFSRARGANRFPVILVPGRLLPLRVVMRAGYEAESQQGEVAEAIKAAVGVTDEAGLFGIKARRFGQSAHVSQIIAAVQNVPGVTWVEVDEAGYQVRRGQRGRAGKLTRLIRCPAARVLSLAAADFVLSLIADETKESEQ